MQEPQHIAAEVQSPLLQGSVAGNQIGGLVAGKGPDVDCGPGRPGFDLGRQQLIEAAVGHAFPDLPELHFPLVVVPLLADGLNAFLDFFGPEDQFAHLFAQGCVQLQFSCRLEEVEQVSQLPLLLCDQFSQSLVEPPQQQRVLLVSSYEFLVNVHDFPPFSQN